MLQRINAYERIVSLIYTALAARCACALPRRRRFRSSDNRRKKEEIIWLRRRVDYISSMIWRLIWRSPRRNRYLLSAYGLSELLREEACSRQRNGAYVRIKIAEKRRKVT